MPDPYSGAKTNQEIRAEQEFVERARSNRIKILEEEEEKRKKATKEPKKKVKPVKIGEKYKKGVEALARRGYLVELPPGGGPHVGHKIYKKMPPPSVKGISYPADFEPYQEICSPDDLDEIETTILNQEDDVREFWEPLHHPTASENELKAFVGRQIGMLKIQQGKNLNRILNYEHTFDPAGGLGGEPVRSPRIWVPDRSWFHPSLNSIQFSDIFTIFPPAEQEILKLLIGRIGVGRANHQPPGMKDPVDHTARMAAIVVGKDAGLGKSTLFNGFLNAIVNCGFTYSTFKATDDRFGLASPALADVAYKDDTALHSLKKLITSEETKIMITNGLLQAEEKFERAEQIWPKAVLLVNSNEWNSNFAYDIDPGIQDRIKLVSTLREAEVNKLREQIPPSSASHGSPDLRPKAHIPFLSNKFGVSEEAIYLWALRLATDRFWEVISDNADPSINRLQVEVRYWTSRLRIRFKSDVTQALINGMAFAWALRTGKKKIPELTPEILLDALEHFYFVGVDPSCQRIHKDMKEQWEKVGRTSTHYYQGFREIRWESVKKSLEQQSNVGKFNSINSTDEIKKIVELLVMRDGFKVGGGAQYVIENWENMRYAYSDILQEASAMLSEEDPTIVARISNVQAVAEDSWMNTTDYSPDVAEEFRDAAFAKIYRLPGKTE
jgi:hypothetical protein